VSERSERTIDPASERSVFLVERHGDGTATVTMNRPDKLNAMHRAYFEQLRAVMADLDADADVRAVVVTGAGRAFSAGGDIESFELLTDVRAARNHLRLVFDAFDSVARCSATVIAAVNGIAFGGGTELTLACDLAVASSAAQFGFKEARHNLMPGFGLVRGPEVIGRAWTQRLAVTAETIDAGEARRIGLVQEVVEPDRLLPRCRELATSIAANGPIAVEEINAFMHRHHADGLAEVTEATALLFSTDDHRIARDAFLRGTPKVFTGR
jgi:enoyl-CoA hydratase/carnithine racemase